MRHKKCKTEKNVEKESFAKKKFYGRENIRFERGEKLVENFPPYFRYFWRLYGQR